MKNKQIILFLTLKTCFLQIFSGFAPSIYVTAPEGFVPIQHIVKGDQVASYSKKTILRTVTHIISKKTAVYVQFKVNNELFIVSCEQKFYLPHFNTWRRADVLVDGDVLFSLQTAELKVFDKKIVNKKQRLFRIAVTKPHNLFIGKNQLLAHNGVPVIFGLTWLFGSGAIEFAGATFGLGVLGGWLTTKFTKNNCTYDHYDDDTYYFDIDYEESSEKGWPSDLDKNSATICSGGSGGEPPDPPNGPGWFGRNHNKKNKQHFQNNERKKNSISKAEFFKSVSSEYYHLRNGIYRLRKGAHGIGRAEYIQWDNLHCEVECYSKTGLHLGAADPITKIIYKIGKKGRSIDV